MYPFNLLEALDACLSYDDAITFLYPNCFEDQLADDDDELLDTLQGMEPAATREACVATSEMELKRSKLVAVCPWVQATPTTRGTQGMPRAAKQPLGVHQRCSNVERADDVNTHRAHTSGWLAIALAHGLPSEPIAAATLHSMSSLCSDEARKNALARALVQSAPMRHPSCTVDATAVCKKRAAQQGMATTARSGEKRREPKAARCDEQGEQAPPSKELLWQRVDQGAKWRLATEQWETLLEDHPDWFVPPEERRYKCQLANKKANAQGVAPKCAYKFISTTSAHTFQVQRVRSNGDGGARRGEPSARQPTISLGNYDTLRKAVMVAAVSVHFDIFSRRLKTLVEGGGKGGRDSGVAPVLHAGHFDCDLPGE